MAVGQALLVTFLWSTSWVLIKIGLDDLQLAPLPFAGLRYTLAAAMLLPFGIRALRARPDRAFTPRLAGRVAIYGLLFVAVAQGAQFVALGLLPRTDLGGIYDLSLLNGVLKQRGTAAVPAA